MITKGRCPFHYVKVLICNPNFQEPCDLCDVGLTHFQRLLLGRLDLLLVEARNGHGMDIRAIADHVVGKYR